MIDFFGRNGSLEIFGVNLVGVTAENGRKLAMTAAVLIVVPLIGWAISKLISLTGRVTSRRTAFRRRLQASGQAARSVNRSGGATLRPETM
jgi:hypothetical protein